MTLTPERLGEIARAALDEGESRGAVYLDPMIRAAGSTVAAGRQSIPVREPCVVVFVDPTPAVNWGHACRYLLVNAESGTIESVDAQFPPPREGLRLLHRGDSVESWMLLTQEPV